MAQYQLVDQLYLAPTAAGAFYAVSSPEDEPIRRLLLALLSHHASPLVDLINLGRWLRVDDEQRALQLLHRAQTLALIQGDRKPSQLSDSGVGRELQDLLPRLSSLGKGLLVDWNGLSLMRCGLNDETAEALSALSADLVSVQLRHYARLKETLHLPIQGWAAVDAYGASRIGAWPLFVGPERLMLVLLGEPRLNQQAFVTLVWVLISRYGLQTETEPRSEDSADVAT